ncbi:helix-turn-helix domain-containing protein [Flavobacterium cucumis]|uniref:Helix-turn-helix n=1 Tax=Flavobacterium cucumis TaxID=416016 RepID=A0A1M7ZVE9_9FLAO|nr:helix-turn-helix domain-containing protein [Flavobacterium cucumis]SHO72864.1 Helix-turn-helix [Flavobacterium cucumis]
MKNFISINISYLVNKTRLSKDEFGEMFNLGKGSIGNYILEKAIPKLETIQKICSHFEISIDDFVNKDISNLPKKSLNEEEQEKRNEYIERNYRLLKEQSDLQEEIIVMLKDKLQFTEEKLKQCEQDKNISKVIK